MTEVGNDGAMPVILGSVEPHRTLLRQLPPGAPVHKVMRAEHFVASVCESYLHFNRVDAYADFPDDGEELAKDRQINGQVRFLKAPSFTASHYYARQRSRTYACCFSTEKSQYLWEQYGNGGARGKVCITFDFEQLRSTLNRTVQEAIDRDLLIYHGQHCHQIFSINYGLVDYVDRGQAQRASAGLPNPIEYIYCKDVKHAEERELRVSLSALGVGHYALHDGSFLDFGESFQLAFDFKDAMHRAVITEIECSADTDLNWLNEQLDGSRVKLCA